MHCITTFHIFLISLHIKTKMSCFKEVNASSIFANCLSMTELRKTRRQNGLESFSEHITGYLQYFFHIKTMKIEQFMNYHNKNFIYSLRMTLYKITLTYEKVV